MKKVLLAAALMTATALSAAAETAVFGGGCFWCVEGTFLIVPGVTKVVSGYAGGRVANPTYEQVCAGETGHAEVVQVTFDPAKVKFRDLVDLFWHMHDPTTLNRQGGDVGTQYRSIILTHDDGQRKIAEEVIRAVAAEGLYDGRIVTQVVPFEGFHKAEEYHQDYFAKNPYQPYCRAVVAPKVAKFRKKWQDRLKAEL